jgi:hypothetical protein
MKLSEYFFGRNGDSWSRDQDVAKEATFLIRLQVDVIVDDGAREEAERDEAMGGRGFVFKGYLHETLLSRDRNERSFPNRCRLVSRDRGFIVRVKIPLFL